MADSDFSAASTVMDEVMITKENAEEYFDNSTYWEFEKCLGAGSNGIAVLMKERTQYVRNSRRMAVKIATYQGVPDLQREINFLEIVRGGKHIVRMLAHTKDIAKAAMSEKRGNQTYEQYMETLTSSNDALHSLPASSVFLGLSGMHGPAVALEYIEGVTCLDFMLNIERLKLKVPNRILWSLFLCLIRATIGLAYPLSRPEGAPSALETIPTDGRPPRNIIHGDFAPRNVMIGPTDDVGGEHTVGHTMKFIDFGKAQEVNNSQSWRIIPDNVYLIGNLMAGLIYGFDFPRFNSNYRGFETSATALLPRPQFDNFPDVDLELRDLIARSMYTDLTARPGLNEMLDIALRATSTKGAFDFRQPQEESDDALRRFWQATICDVPDFGAQFK